jgi:hypothetical protein
MNSPHEPSNIRKQLIRVAEHWGQQRGVDVKELIFRLSSAPVVIDDPDWDPTAGQPPAALYDRIEENGRAAWRRKQEAMKWTNLGVELMAKLKPGSTWIKAIDPDKGSRVTVREVNHGDRDFGWVVAVHAFEPLSGSRRFKTTIEKFFARFSPADGHDQRASEDRE